MIPLCWECSFLCVLCMFHTTNICPLFACFAQRSVELTVRASDRDGSTAYPECRAEAPPSSVCQLEGQCCLCIICVQFVCVCVCVMYDVCVQSLCLSGQCICCVYIAMLFV